MDEENIQVLEVDSRFGPKVQKLEEIAKQAETFETSIQIEFNPAKPVPINVSRQCTLMIQVAAADRWKRPASMLELHTSDGYWYRGFLSEGMTVMADLCKGDHPFTERGTVVYESVTVKSKGAALPAKDLKKLATEAWCEALQVLPPDFRELKAKANAKKSAAADLHNQLLEGLRSGPEGVKIWNQNREGHPGKFKQSDLQGADLTELYMYDQDFQASNFDRAKLNKATILSSDLSKSTFRGTQMEALVLTMQTNCAGCDFTGATLMDADLDGRFSECNFSAATLKRAKMSGSSFARCNFSNTDLSAAEFFRCDLRGADLAQADLSGATFDYSSYDHETKFPPNFAKPHDRQLEFRGHGTDPLLLRELTANALSGPVDFQTFVEQLSNGVDSDRLKKSLKMLKSERFQLFSQTSKDAIVGIVKSQTDPDLVYSCSLTHKGEYSCCTQNLFACGGLRGALCKHLLVLLIGLAKAKELDPTATYQWVILSLAQRPDLDKSAATEVFMKYQGAQAGNIDWRPTETIPEDYYAF